MIRPRPQAGLLVVFPSWLYHWVHPYTGQRPRVAVSFNATLGAVATDQASTGQDVTAHPIESHTAAQRTAKYKETLESWNLCSRTLLNEHSNEWPQ